MARQNYTLNTPTVNVGHEPEPYVGAEVILPRIGKICRLTLKTWCRSGMPHFRPTRRTILFKWSLVEKWLADRNA